MTTPRRGSARAARLHSTDARTAATQQDLIHALSTVVRTEGFAAASATRIAREAGLSRSGFYEHFANIDELSVFVVDELLSRATNVDLQARSSADPAHGPRPHEAVDLLLTSILEERELFSGILLSDRAGGVLGRVMITFARSTRRVVEAARPELSEPEKDMHAAAIGGAVVGLVMHYLRTDDERTVAELAREMIEVLPEWMYSREG